MMQREVDENAVKTSLIQYLVLTGWLVLRINSGAVGSEYTDKRGRTKKRFLRFVKWFAGGIPDEDGDKGVSDIIALRDGVALVVEAKAIGRLTNVSDAQRAFLQQWREHGGISCVASGVDDLIITLNGIGMRI